MQTCAFCGGVAPARTLDMTGLGSRCTMCGVKSELAVANGQAAVSYAVAYVESFGARAPGRAA